MGAFLHVYIVPKEGVTRQHVEAKLNKAIDWIRYGEGVYLVYTNSDVAKWKARLIDFVKPGGNLCIAKLDITERKGYISNELWRWIGGKVERS